MATINGESYAYAIVGGALAKAVCSKNVQAAIGPPAICAAMCASL